MSQVKGGEKNRGYHSNKKINCGDKKKEIVENTNENSFVLQQFRAYATELDDKHDRFERIVKTGRDITIESKRIIFLLHTIDKKSKQESVLCEADLRLQNVAQNHFKAISRELENQDPYLYLKAYRNGLEEYIEAVTFYQYLSSGNMKNWLELGKALTYTSSEKSKFIQILITPFEYILGISDLTGELMRQCINNLATGDSASCYETCNFVRNMYKGFLGCVSISNKEINRKLCTLKQSLHKMENVCYTIKIRGSEIPKHILVDVATEEYIESDEGYQVY
ncbi:translin-associated protein X [Apis mellifera caucasica]|uniref:Translin-associated protein X n=1 Tax=Apis mellifera TaxID=7460 RepID=A0A7M7L5I2_APIME|nr:translin-associated protein X [Apis mellifera]KAG6799281.1 translin-associated protein X [Apis mellifera caucasica]KAG9433985.1 translin-associated protein X [Apis mellifera carnica]|eukprot:XP_026296630.1 translin-associated protein X [Apis mellifera]